MEDGCRARSDLLGGGPKPTEQESSRACPRDVVRAERQLPCPTKWAGISRLDIARWVKLRGSDVGRSILADDSRSMDRTSISAAQPDMWPIAVGRDTVTKRTGAEAALL